MPTYYDSAKAAFVSSSELSRGGEGVVWQIQNRPELLAKIYLPGATTSQEKIAWMIGNPPHDPTAQKLNHTSIAWPRSLLFDDKRAFAGFLMPFVRDTVPLLHVYNPRLRSQAPFNVNWLFLHRTARNLCSAVGALHDKGYVIGDINEGNIVVRKEALISIIDTDSFQVQARTAKGAKTFHCPVGKEEFTPPELQGKSFATVSRTQHHDSFGLGVIIFLLLMEGVHPFKSHWRGNSDPPALSEKISRGLFPHSSSPAMARQVGPPKLGPRFDHLHPVLQEIFRRCFESGSQPPFTRPTTEEWERAVITAENALIQCANGHYFSGHLQACPHCPGNTKGAQIPLTAQPGKSKSSAPPPVKPPSAPRMKSPPPPPAKPPPPPPPPPVAPPAANPRSTWRLMAGGAVLAGVALAGFLFFGDGLGLKGTVTPSPQRGASSTVVGSRESAEPTLTESMGMVATRESGLLPTQPTIAPLSSGNCWTDDQIMPSVGGARQWSVPPAMSISDEKTYVATFMTSKGAFSIELWADRMPVTVNNFICLARAGYYDGTGFYRVTTSALQGGDPTGTGTGGPGYTILDEPIIGDYTRGALAMVNEGANTSGSRFLIFANNFSGLKRYPIFGSVVSGMDVIDRIVDGANQSDETEIYEVKISVQ